MNGFAVSHAKWFDVEIDAEQNEKVIIDITTNLIPQVRGSRKVGTKHKRGCKLSN